MRLLSHIELAHSFWLKHLRAGHHAIDATCGRGKDSLLIAQTILTEDSGILVCMDIQEEALDSTRTLLKEQLTPAQYQRVKFLQQSHCQFPEDALPIHLIIYNLGYLPGGDKGITTSTDTTLLSLESALKIIAPGGLICTTCYPGHEEGRKEYEEIILWADKLDKNNFKATRYHSLSQPSAPSVIFIVKNEF